LRAEVAAVVLTAALAVGGAMAQTPAPSTAPDAAKTQEAPSTPTPPEPPSTPSALISEPPVTEGDAAPATRPRWASLDTALEDVRITDLMIALFALVVAIFAFRTSSSTARMRALAQRQAEDNRRAVEASEKAADSAERSAHAAEQALASVRDTAERQLRPYVTVRQFLQAPVKDDRQNVHGWLLQVAWQNTGATPTKGFRYWAMLREFDGAIPDDFEFTPAGLKDFAGGELGSNGTVNSPPLFISLQQIARIQDGSRKALLLGQADYSDMAGTAKRETKFCVELVLVNDPGGANGSPFSFSYYPKHNSIT
jgi:hypothetical protein